MMFPKHDVHGPPDEAVGYEDETTRHHTTFVGGRHVATIQRTKAPNKVSECPQRDAYLPARHGGKGGAQEEPHILNLSSHQELAKQEEMAGHQPRH